MAGDERDRAGQTTVRDGDAGLEVLMVRRSLQASFMPGAYVFPGGAVDAGDGSAAHHAVCDESAEQLAQRIGTVTQVGDAALAYAVAALRECFEECGLWLGAAELRAGRSGVTSHHQVSVAFVDSAGRTTVWAEDGALAGVLHQAQFDLDLFAVGKVLGHASYQSTQRYSHLANDTLLAAVEAGAAKQAC